MKALTDLLRRELFPGLQAGFGAVPLAQGGVLMAGEDPGGPRVVPARASEFAAGRAAIRQAMADLGIAAQPVPRGADRAPVWPEGLCGSLSHAAGVALAVVMRAGSFSPGLDLEPAEPLPPELIPALLTAREQAWAQRQPDPGLAARRIFVAKEAGYKAQYPLSRSLLGFHAAEFDDLGGGHFTLTLLQAAGDLPAGLRLPGRMALAEGLILAGVSLPIKFAEDFTCSGAA